MLNGDNSYRPRSKKERDKLRAQRSAERKAKRERESQQSSHTTSTFVPDYSYPVRNPQARSGPSCEPILETRDKEELTEEMLEREKEAQAEIERKKQCIAPAYNKGAYQYVGSEEQAKWIGK